MQCRFPELLSSNDHRLLFSLGYRTISRSICHVRKDFFLSSVLFSSLFIMVFIISNQIGAKRIHTVRTRGGNTKYRALRLDHGNFSWGSESTFINSSSLWSCSCVSSYCSGIARKTRILDVVYNASNNELVRTKTLVKNCVIQIDSTPFRQWWVLSHSYEAYLIRLYHKTVV